jgi:hypothetical protein
VNLGHFINEKSLIEVKIIFFRSKFSKILSTKKNISLKQYKNIFFNYYQTKGSPNVAKQFPIFFTKFGNLEKREYCDIIFFPYDFYLSHF